MLCALDNIDKKERIIFCCCCCCCGGLAASMLNDQIALAHLLHSSEYLSRERREKKNLSDSNEEENGFFFSSFWVKYSKLRFRFSTLRERSKQIHCDVLYLNGMVFLCAMHSKLLSTLSHLADGSLHCSYANILLVWLFVVLFFVLCGKIFNRYKLTNEKKTLMHFWRPNRITFCIRFVAERGISAATK